MKTIHTDVAIVGSGCAGAAAALSAAELGLQVTVFEKTAQVGGPVKGANGPFAAGSHLQKERQHTFGPAQALQLLMEHTHGRVDARLAAEYFNKSADTIAWLESIGVRFSDVVAYFKGAEYTWHFKAPDSPHITEALMARAVELGAQVQLETSVQRIRMEHGRAVGLSARQQDGTEIEVRAGAVVLATGGFGGNPDWIREHTGFEHGKNLFSFAFPEAQGDGIRMAWEAGAGRSPMMMQTYVCLPAPYWGPGGTPPDLGSFRQPGLMVNLQGERFMNEETMSNPAYAANAVGRQKDGCAFMLLDLDTARHYEQHDWDFLMSKLPITRSGDLEQRIAAARAEGFQHLFAADSVAELAQATGIDAQALQRTVDEYNQACDQHEDRLFHKNPDYLRPLRARRLYAAQFFLGGYGSLGGIKINHRTEVLSARHDIIPGLYAAGRDANALFGDTYPYTMSGNDSAFDFNTGRLAGEHIARYLAARAGS